MMTGGTGENGICTRTKRSDKCKDKGRAEHDGPPAGMFQPCGSCGCTVLPFNKRDTGS